MDLLFPNEQVVSPDGDNFQKEISQMMHGFGDGPTPSASTVSLVEVLTLQQMRGVLQEAHKNSERRGHKCIAPEDIIFLMRNNKVKLNRMIAFMKAKYVARTKNKLLGSTDTFIPNMIVEDENENMKKRKKAYCEVVEFLNETIHTSKSPDDDIVKQQRTQRANRISQNISLDKYEAYTKARRVSFGFSGTKFAHNKFKQWLCPLNDFNVTSQSFDLLSYLAYETVAEIVDLALIVRQDMRNVLDDPFIKLEGGNYCNPVSLVNSTFIKSGQEGVSPITVAEVREAMRRFSTPRHTTNGLFYRNMKNDIPPKFLAM